MICFMLYIYIYIYIYLEKWKHVTKYIDLLIFSISIYKLIRMYSRSLTETSRIKMRPSSSVSWFLIVKVSFPKQVVRPPQKCLFLREKKT